MENQTQQMNVDIMKQSTDQMRMQMQDVIIEYLNQNEVTKRIKNTIGRQQRFNVNLDELRQFNPKLANFVVRDPIQAIKLFQDQLNQSIKGMNDGSGKGNLKANLQTGNQFPSKIQQYYINFEGNFGKNHITPRGLKSDLVNQFVAVNGIVTRMSIVKPKIQTSVHYCEVTKRGHVKNYNDQFNLLQIAENEGAVSEQTNAFPTKDQNDNPLSAEYGYCVYKDSQVITIQEMPERAPTGQLPRSIQVVLENDLVDKVKPGDRIQVTGVFRTVAPHGPQTSGIFRTFLVATGVQSLNIEKEKPNLNENDIKNIKKLSQNQQLFDILGNSVAPSIEGNNHVKKALLLQLLGGAEKNLENGTHLRGDINIMMVGDPSTAKSQLLRHMMDIAPLAINTTGRGSSGVGLTAAVTVDKDTGEKHLEAGAMVLADRGIVCIDEFDKMNDIDRVAIHEVMEQQTVTIAKAGIHVSLNARCSVIAAANPIYGEYARDQPVGRNIGLPDSLLSRFDLLFVMLDEKDPEHDRKIAERVIQNHRYQAANSEFPQFNYFNDDFVIEPEYKDDRREDSKGTMMFEKINLSLHNKNEKNSIVTREFLKKYISYAKSQKHPELTAKCIEYAATIYSLMRTKALNYDQSKVSSPVTVRTLETIIRLATAHAKLRLSKKIEETDLDIASILLNNSIFQENNQLQPDEDEDEYNDKIQFNTQPQRSKRGQDREMKKEHSPAKKLKKEDATPAKSLSKKQAKPIKDDEDPRPSKKMKIDHDEAVGQLFASQTQATKAGAGAQISIKTKVSQKLKSQVYKYIHECKNKKNTATVADIMAIYEKAKGNKDAEQIKNTQHLQQILLEMESDNFVFYDQDQDLVILV
ncbi:mcm2 3 5 family protein [Stylonychia lemnae]|uniref:DNA replication licensing factor MCM3 n=1 Tax=Stylonychia lemnae TaxID=5949 RepID=A0A077ZWI1_STYLE|nr:mcm2 3 5 family protein [Stylonychia lemnae]|eukprot:CDW73635.1 mcm2 3 5 family protein [Stylonychia lemnae]